MKDKHKIKNCKISVIFKVFQINTDETNVDKKKK